MSLLRAAPPRRARALAAALALLALPDCRDWRGQVEPGLAAAEPEQIALEGAAPIELEAEGHRITLTPRASYRITAYAAELSRQLLDEWKFAVPMDLALVWGPVADPAVLGHLKFHLSGRYVSYWYDAQTPPAAVGALPGHIANHHLIPASEQVADVLADVRIGDLVRLQGKLVDLVIRDPAARVAFQARTSLTRTDVGSGACEVLYVEAAERL